MTTTSFERHARLSCMRPIAREPYFAGFIIQVAIGEHHIQIGDAFLGAVVVVRI